MSVHEKTMTREQLLQFLKVLAEKSHADEAEGSHHAADYALLDYINDPEITEAFTNIERWYA